MQNNNLAIPSHSLHIHVDLLAHTSLSSAVVEEVCLGWLRSIDFTKRGLLRILLDARDDIVVVCRLLVVLIQEFVFRTLH